MSELIALLGTISVILTFTASYRLLDYLYDGGPGLPILISLSAALVFMLLFEYIILVSGLVALFIPIAVVYRWKGGFPLLERILEKPVDRIKQWAYDEQLCPRCKTENEHSNQFCSECGKPLT